jgi:hypothetical protein
MIITDMAVEVWRKRNEKQYMTGMIAHPYKMMMSATAGKLLRGDWQIWAFDMGESGKH